MGAGISTTIPESRLPTYLPQMKPTTRYSPPPPPQTAPPTPATTTSTATAAFNSAGSRVIVFHSSTRWRAYFESPKSSNKLPVFVSANRLAGTKIVIEFTAGWCGPCKLIEPFFNELAAKYTDVDFVKADVDELMDVARQFGIHTMPTFLLMKRGQEVERIAGVNKEELLNKVEKHRHLDNTLFL